MGTESTTAVAVPAVERVADVRALSSARVRYLALAGLILIALALVVVQFFATGTYWSDDAFISFRYAQNLADGRGPVWNPGERVEGYTNFGWMLLIAGALKTGVDATHASRALGLLATAGTLALVPVLASQLRTPWTWRWWLVAGGAIVALGLNTGFSLWTFAGLETPATVLFITAGITLHLWEERTERLPLASAFAFLAAALTRPDAVVVWGVTALFKLARLLGDDRREQVVPLAMWGAAFLVPFGAYWLWRWSYYGEFFPNTYYLKTGRNSRIIERGVEYTRDFFLIYGAVLCLPALLAAWRERLTPHRPALYMLAVLAAWCLYVIDAGGDWMPYFRFFAPMLPMLYVLIGHGAVEAGDALAERGVASRLAAGVAGAIVVAVAVWAIAPFDYSGARNPQGLPVNSKGFAGAVDLRVGDELGAWMDANIPAEWTVATIASGMLPYYTEQRYIDMLGVNDEHIAHLDVPLGYGPAGHEKHDGGYVISRKPEIIWIGLNIEKRARDTVEKYYEPYTIQTPVIRDITGNLYLWLLYRPVTVPMRYGYFNFLLRNDLPSPAEACPAEGCP